MDSQRSYCNAHLDLSPVLQAPGMTEDADVKPDNAFMSRAFGIMRLPGSLILSVLSAVELASRDISRSFALPIIAVNKVRRLAVVLDRTV